MHACFFVIFDLVLSCGVIAARPSTKELFLMIPMHMMNREIIPGR